MHPGTWSFHISIIDWLVTKQACRQAGTGRELASSQQFAVWEVEELGIVLAFRGTASFEDAIVDIAMTPVPLQLPRGRSSPGLTLCDPRLSIWFGTLHHIMTGVWAVSPI